MTASKKFDYSRKTMIQHSNLFSDLHIIFKKRVPMFDHANET